MTAVAGYPADLTASNRATLVKKPQLMSEDNARSVAAISAILRAVEKPARASELIHTHPQARNVEPRKQQHASQQQQQQQFILPPPSPIPSAIMKMAKDKCILAPLARERQDRRLPYLRKDRASSVILLDSPRAESKPPPSDADADETASAILRARSMGKKTSEDYKHFHKIAERKRRRDMRDVFDALTEVLPGGEHEKRSKYETLVDAVLYLESLESAKLRLSAGLNA